MHLGPVAPNGDDGEGSIGVGCRTGSDHIARRLPRLLSEWLVSEEELEILLSSPAKEAP